MPTVVTDTSTIKVPGIKPRENLIKDESPFNPFRNRFGIIPMREKIKTLDMSGRSAPQIKIPAPGEGLPRIVHFCADQSGCGFWRMLWPSQDLLAYNKAVVMTKYQMIFDPKFYMGIEAVRVQRQATEHQLEFVKHLRKISDNFKRQTGKGFKILYDVDDICAPADCIEDYNVCKQGFTEDSILKNMKEIVHICDEMSVVSEYMREHYQKYLEYDKISVLPNYAPKHIFDPSFDMQKTLFAYKKNRKKPRILYAGSMTHFDVANRANQKDDFYHVVDEILKDLTTTKKYEWVFMGGALPRVLRQYIGRGVEFHSWSPLPEYPQSVKDLNCQIMLAPLMDNAFNKAKSNIKLTEGGMFGIPVVAQDLECYNHNGWKYLFKTGPEMIGQIEKILKNEATFKQAVEFGRKYSSQYYLKDHLDEYIMLYTTEYGDPKRKENKWFYEHNLKQFNNCSVVEYVCRR